MARTYRRDGRGRFAGGGGGGGGRKRSGGGRKRSGGSRKRSSGSKKRTSHGGKTVRSQGGGAQARVSTLRGKQGTKTYTYKVSRSGMVGKAPGRISTNLANPRLHNPKTRPGTPLGKNTRFVSRGHMVTRGVTWPGIGRTQIIGRAHSRTVVQRARQTGRLGPGYVVSYGKPTSRFN